MNDLAPFWNELLPQNDDRSKPAGYRRSYCNKVIDLLAERHPGLYSGKTGATLSAEEADELVSILKKNTPGHVFKHRVSFLVRGLERGTLEHGWDVAIPLPPVVIPRDRPRLTCEDFQQLPALYEIERAFLASLNDDPPDTPSSRLGQLLLSAILYGGLVERRWLPCWIEALSTPQCHSSTLWLDMVYTAEHLERERKVSRKKGSRKRVLLEKTDWEIRRRWFADALTQILILRWYERFPDDREGNHLPSPLLAIRHYLERIMPPTTHIDDNLITDLITIAATRLGIEVPPFLTAYAEGRIKSVSLPPSTWKRLLTGKRIIGNDQPELIHNPPPLSESLSLSSPIQVAPPAVQDQLLRKLLTDILPRSTNRLKKATEVRATLAGFYQEHQEHLCPALVCLIHWGIDMLTHYNRQELPRGRVKSALRSSSVRTYLETISKKLIAVVGDLNILELESDELHDVYREIVDLCPTQKGKHAAGWRLAAFHEFLVVRCNAQPVDFSDITVNAGPAEQGVDANLLTPAEFDQVKKVLAPQVGKASRLKKMQLLIAILGFRCGLRRTEVRKLRLADLQGTAEPELLVRNNRYAYVKSNESIRRLPLASLLDADELTLLRDWRRDRFLEDRGNIENALLFCEESKPTTLVNDHEVFTPIEQAMRRVTGDPSLRFHHLRHSFASWLTLRLLWSFSPKVRKRFCFLDHHLFSEQACHDLRVSILGNHRLGRQALYAVALLCGHGSPAVTLLHYLHLCDWLLYHELAIPENQPSLNASTIMFLTGISKHVVYHARKTHGTEGWHISIVLDKLNVPVQLLEATDTLPLDSSALPNKETKSANHMKIPLWCRVETVLRERQLGKLPFPELATRNGFSEAQVTAWCTTAFGIRDMMTKRGELRHVNGATRRNNPNFLFPLPLRLDADKEMAEKILAVFQSRAATHKKMLAEGVSSFVAAYCVSEGGVPFANPRDAKRYLRFLELLNIPHQLVRVNRTMPRTAKKSPDAERKSLAKRLGVLENTIVIKKLHPTEYTLTGELTIQVLNPPVGCKGQIKASYGFRFAMYMLAIMTA